MKMKKWIALLLACVMALSLMACTGGKDPDPTKEPDQPSAPAESTPAESQPADDNSGEKKPEDYSGTLTIYSPHDQDPLNAGVKMFEDAYPNVKVELVADRSEERRVGKECAA